MALRLPSNEDLRNLAIANHFQLSDEEVESFQAIIPGLFDAYESLERMPSPHERVKYPERDAGFRPSREDDPFNAIFRRCSLKGAPSGPLAGQRFGIKNNTSIAGMPMSCGSLVLEG